MWGKHVKNKNKCVNGANWLTGADFLKGGGGGGGGCTCPHLTRCMVFAYCCCCCCCCCFCFPLSSPWGGGGGVVTLFQSLIAHFWVAFHLCCIMQASSVKLFILVQRMFSFLLMNVRESVYLISSTCIYIYTYKNIPGWSQQCNRQSDGAAIYITKVN